MRGNVMNSLYRIHKTNEIAAEEQRAPTLMSEWGRTLVHEDYALLDGLAMAILDAHDDVQKAIWKSKARNRKAKLKTALRSLQRLSGELLEKLP
jgi:hypothetical protein